MGTLRVITVSVLTAVLSACATGPSGQSFESPVGEWQTKILWEGSGSRGASMVIADATRATYEFREGRVLFTDTDDPLRWRGYWIEAFAMNNVCADTRDGSNAWGVAEFRFNEHYNRFEGTWNHCGEGETWGWNGYR